MKRWGPIFPILYFLLLFLLVFAFDFPREVTRQWMWIQIGGIVIMAVLGSYLDGYALLREVIAIGVFVLLWLGLAFVVNVRKEYFALLGLIIVLFLDLIVRKGS